MNRFKIFMHEKLMRLVNLSSYLWLLNCVKAFKRIFLIVILMNLLTSLLSIGMVIVSKQLIDTAVSGNLSRAAIIILLFILTYIGNISLSGLNAMITVQFSEKMTYRIQRDLIERLFRTEWTSLNGFHSGDILTRLTTDITNVVNLWVTTFPEIISLLTQLGLGFFTLYYFDKTLALFAFLLGPISVVISWFLGHKLKKLQHMIQAAESCYRSFISEAIQNILIVKSFEYENGSLKRIIENQNEKYQWVIRKNRLSVTTNLVLAGGYWFGFAAAFLWGALKLSRGTTSFGTFTAFLQLVGHIQAPFDGLSKSLPQMISSLASVERLMEFEALGLEQERTEFAFLTGKKVGISMDGVTFGYTLQKEVLSDISFQVEPGEIAALIGVSGEGKTTLMRLLLALLKPNSGSVFLYEEGDQKKVLSAGTRGYFTYVPQGNTLFSGTISDNLRVGKTDADDNEIEEAVKAACAWDFIMGLPNKFDTVIGEAGLGLSEGQAQRLCIARALLRSSPVLLLDEATSALDMETERKVFLNIRKFEPKRTCIAITHRLSVLASCDTVYRLENGRLYKHEVGEFASIFENVNR